MGDKKQEDKRWYTVGLTGKYETIIKDSNIWKEHGYSMKETDTEVLLIRKTI